MIISFFPGGGGNRYIRYLSNLDWKNLNCSYDQFNHNQDFIYRYLLESAKVNFVDNTILTHCVNQHKIKKWFPKKQIVFIKTDIQASLRREWMLHGHDRFIKKNVESLPDRLEHYFAVKDPDWPLVTSIDDLKKLPNDVLTEITVRYAAMTNKCQLVTEPLAEITKVFTDKINSSYHIIDWHLRYYQEWPLTFESNVQIIDVDNDTSEFSTLMGQELDQYKSEIFDEVWKVVFKNFTGKPQ